MYQGNSPAQAPIKPDPGAQLPHKHLHPGIWVGILIAAASIVGYLVWANASKEWPFEENLQLNVSPTPQPTPTPPTPPTTTTDPTASWKTYTNAQYGFEFKYPSTLDSIVVNATSGSNFYKRYVSIDIDTPAKIAQMKQPNPGSGGKFPLFRFGAFVPKDRICDLGCGSDPVLRTMTIGGISANMCGGEDIGAPEGNMHLQFTRDNTTLFSAQSGFYSGSNQQIVDKILATFKFTN